MGYYNPIYIYGVPDFLRDARDAGVDGLIVVDLPPEEDAELCLPACEAGLNWIRLATPTTDARRLPRVLSNTSGRSEEHTSELQSLMRISYAVFCLKKKNHEALTIRAPY